MTSRCPEVTGSYEPGHTARRGRGVTGTTVPTRSGRSCSVLLGRLLDLLGLLLRLAPDRRPPPRAPPPGRAPPRRPPRRAARRPAPRDAHPSSSSWLRRVSQATPSSSRRSRETSSRAGLMIVCSSSFEWWFTTVASSSSVSSYFWVSVPLALQELQQRLDDLGVLLLAVLLLVARRSPGACAASGRPSPPRPSRGRRAPRRAPGGRPRGRRRCGGPAQQVLEEAVVLQDPLQHVAARRSGDLDVDLAHRPTMAEPAALESRTCRLMPSSSPSDCNAPHVRGCCGRVRQRSARTRHVRARGGGGSVAGGVPDRGLAVLPRLSSTAGCRPAKRARGCGSSARRRGGRRGRASRPAGGRAPSARVGLVDVVGRVDEHEVGGLVGRPGRARGAPPTVLRTTRTPAEAEVARVGGDDLGRPAVGLDQDDGGGAAAAPPRARGRRTRRRGRARERRGPRPGRRAPRTRPRGPGRSSAGCPSPVGCAGCARRPCRR